VFIIQRGRAGWCIAAAFYFYSGEDEHDDDHGSLQCVIELRSRLGLDKLYDNNSIMEIMG